MPPAVLLTHPSSLDHDTGAHPEQIARIPALLDAFEAADWCGMVREASPAVALETLHAVHPAAYVNGIRELCESGGGQLDVDTLVSPGSYDAALHAAGGAVRLVDLLLTGAAPWGFAAHRPPGHHAERELAMGFCLFGNIAIAAQHAIDAHGFERVLVLDWDVHHGNGTQAIFLESPQVLFISLHEWPMWPGTGATGEVGRAAGEGFTVNLPIPTGSGDEAWVPMVRDVAVPIARAFEPQLVLVSAGYDAHADDPLAGSNVSDDGFAAITAVVADVAAELGAPLGVVLEGGYDLGALGRSAVRTGQVLGGLDGGAGALHAAAIPAHPLADRAAAHHSARWPVLAR